MPTILALTGQELIERFAAYAGLAAIPGLAILSLLYFAQAREVRRLRDWAGGAPERDAGLQEGAAAAARYNVAPRPRPAVPTARPAGTVVRSPAAAAAAASGAGVASRPATAAAAGSAQPDAARPGASGGSAPPAGPVKESAERAAVPAASTAAAQGAAAVRAGGNDPDGLEPAAEPTALRERATPNGPPSEPPSAGDAGPGTADPAVDRPGPGAGPPLGTGAGAGPPRPGVARSGAGGPRRPTSPPGPATALRRPGARLPDRGAQSGPRQTDPEPERSSGTRWLLGLGGVGALGLLVAIVIGIVQLGSGNEERAKPVNTVQGEPAQSQGDDKSDAPAKRRKAKPLVRSQVTVVVLNGTTVPGLAATIADKVEQAGFARGQEADNSEQQLPRSAILYGPGQKRAGQEVAKVLDVSDVRPLDAGTQAIAGADATVVVVVGVDKTT
jgi:hypothetical protein